ncbi:MAG: hypothetical protein ACLQAN_06575 [Acidimicrobiales bacterium]
MTSQERSISRRPRSWRAERVKAWWLLCQPSPKVSSATTQLFVLSSPARTHSRDPEVIPFVEARSTDLEW